MENITFGDKPLLETLAMEVEYVGGKAELTFADNGLFTAVKLQNFTLKNLYFKPYQIINLSNCKDLKTLHVNLLSSSGSEKLAIILPASIQGSLKIEAERNVDLLWR